MKVKISVLLASIGLGLLMWLTDAVLGALLFYKDVPFVNLLFPRELHHGLTLRVTMVGAFAIFGFILSRALAEREAAMHQQQETQRQIEHLNRVLQAIRNVNQLITREKDIQRLLEAACAELVATRGYASAWVVLPGTDATPARAACSSPDEDSQALVALLEAGELYPCMQEALSTPEVVFTRKPAGLCARCPLQHREPAGHAMAVRLEHDGRVWGVLSVALPPQIHDAPEETTLLKEVAGDLAFALHDMTLETRRREADNRLRASEQRYRALFENAPVGIFQTTTRGKVRIANMVMAEMTGYGTPAGAWRELQDLGSQLYVRSEDRDRFLALLEADGEVRDFEYEARRRDGRHIWLLMDARLGPPDPEGGCIIDGFARDITERRQAEAALRESQRTLATLMSNLPGMAYRCRSDDQWTMLFVSEGCRALTGYEPQALIGNAVVSYADLIHPEDRAMVAAHVRRGVEDDGPFTLTYRIRTIDGEERWVWEQGRRIPAPAARDGVARDSVADDGVADDDVADDGQENGTLLEGLVIDITDRRRAEQAREQLLAQIREQATQLQQIMNTVPEGVVLLDADHRILRANPTARQDLRDLAGAQEGDTLVRVGDHTLAQLLTSTQHGPWHTVHTATRTFEIIERPVERENERANWVLLINDVTRERERQEHSRRQEHLASIGQLAAGIAHDFNNIIAVIVLYSQLAQRDPALSPKLREQLGVISEEARRATHLVEQILDFGRRTALARRPLNLVSFLKEEVRLLERTLPESIRISLSYDVPNAIIDADPTRLQQVVMNLAVNARDAMPEGGDLRLHVDCAAPDLRGTAPASEAAPDTWVRLSVSDTGTGIAPDVMPKLFQPFFTTKGTRGSGLGLAQVHGIVAQHKGSIDIQTEVGAGTTFFVYLPAHAQPLEEPAPDTTALYHGHGETLLVVEDNAPLREALVRALTSLGYRVVEAANGRAALTVLEDAPDDDLPDLVLTDLVMPEMGGLPLLRAIRARGLDLPVVMLSGHAGEAELKALRSEGLSGWMPKPPALDDLAALVADVLAGRGNGGQAP